MSQRQNQLVLSPSFSSQSLSSNSPLNITGYYSVVLLLHHTADFISTPLLIVHSALSQSISLFNSLSCPPQAHISKNQVHYCQKISSASQPENSSLKYPTKAIINSQSIQIT